MSCEEGDGGKKVRSKLSLAPELESILKENYKISKDYSFNTAQILTLIVNRNILIKRILEEAGIKIKSLELISKRLPFKEPPDMILRVIKRGAVKASQEEKKLITPVHLFIGILEEKESAGYKLIRYVNLDPEKLLMYIWIITSLPEQKNKIKINLKKEKEIKERLLLKKEVKEDIKEKVVEKGNVCSIKDYVQLSLYKELKELNLKNSLMLKDREKDRIVLSKRDLLVYEVSVSLTELARRGELDPLIGRKHIIDEMIDILNKRRSNNPILIGPPGVGKSAIVEGLSYQLLEDNDKREVLKLDIGRLLKGTIYRGSLTSKISQILKEVRENRDRFIIFIDEIHRILSIQGEEGALSESFKEALSRGEFPCIGATTEEEFKKYIENDKALLRRFTKIYVDEPDEKETIEIVKGSIKRYESYHNVKYSDEAIEFCVKASSRYIFSKHFPDKAFEVIDLAGAKAKRLRKDLVDRRIVGEVISNLSGVPLERVLESDGEKLLKIEDYLKRYIIGQDKVIEKIAQTLRRNLVLNKKENRPFGSFLFLGPSGTGKTSTAKLLAQYLFPGKRGITIFDMSEFSQPYTISRLIGAPPGYVGYDKGGELTDSIRANPYQVVVFDEIEKADKEIWMLLLQILDEGRLKDSKGRYINFSNSVIIMTSNIGGDKLRYSKEPAGFKTEDERDRLLIREDEVLKEAKMLIPDELWARIDAKLFFKPLSRRDFEIIAENRINELKEELYKKYGIEFVYNKDVIEFILDRCELEYGARDIKAKIGEFLETKLADFILQNDIKDGIIRIVSYNGELKFLNGN